VVIVAAVLFAGCVSLALLIWRGRRGPRERDPELEEALERLREQVREHVRGPRATIAAAALIAVLLVAALARNPSRWALLLFALAVLGAAVALALIKQRRSGG
jgi:Na+/H+ antiporter NhaD/arsenite permease-like protein